MILIGTAPDKPVNIILRGAQTSGRSGRIETENPSGRSSRGIRLARGGRSGLSPMASTTGGRSGRVVGWCPPVIRMAPASTTRRPQRPGGGMVPASHRDGARQYHRRPQQSAGEVVPASHGDGARMFGVCAAEQRSSGAADPCPFSLSGNLRALRPPPRG